MSFNGTPSTTWPATAAEDELEDTMMGWGPLQSWAVAAGSPVGCTRSYREAACRFDWKNVVRSTAPNALLMADTSETPDSIDAVIQRCLAGDQDAWAQIVRQHWRKVFNIAYKFTGKHDEAEDLTQDVFLKIFKSLNTFDRRANFQTWLVSVSRNLCIDHYRSVRKERETIDRDVDAGELTPASTTKSPFAALEQRDRVELLKKALGQLPPTLRSAVLLRDIQELSYQEIADRLQLPEGTVKSRINRGRTELARQIRRLRDELETGSVHSRRTGVAG
jgi:RNA polymerase sigma-70 factor, ECF subfamily